MMTEKTPIIFWFRRDLRLADHPAFSAACRTGRPVIPVFIHDEVVEQHGAAPKMRLGLSVSAHSRALAERGSRLILRRGSALAVLRDLAKETGAGAVFWQRLYDPAARTRDSAVKAALKQDGLDVQSMAGHLLFEPWTVQTGQGGFYRVYTPMWKAVRNRDVATCLPEPAQLPCPQAWPKSDKLDSWAMQAGMGRGADVVAPYCVVGANAAADRLAQFVGDRIERYKEDRDFPGIAATSGLSENLTYGEISPRAVWHAGQQALHEGRAGAEHFLKELVWREFAYHLVYHTPHIVDQNWKPGWDRFAWNQDETLEVSAWKRGRTGIPFVDAAMREMFVTGVMHNRGRMIVASYLTKHLLSHWRIGQRWFEDCLIDWDPAANAMGWQWAAGSGPDAAPYFRVFNPVTQLDKFDASGAYSKRWIAEVSRNPPPSALSYFDGIPKAWQLGPDDAYPAPIVPVDQGRKRALEAYEMRDF